MEKALSIKDYTQLKLMFNSSVQEDTDIAIENIKNLDVENIYKILTLKALNLEKKAKILTELDDLFKEEPFASLKKMTTSSWGVTHGFTDLSWNTLYNLINEHYSSNLKVKSFFEKIFKEETENTVMQSIGYDFISNTKINIKWL
jgi:hypothetical protein